MDQQRWTWKTTIEKTTQNLKWSKLNTFLKYDSLQITIVMSVIIKVEIVIKQSVVIQNILNCLRWKEFTN